LARFLAESHEALRANLVPDSVQAMEQVRDRWIQEEKYEQLVGAVLANWTSGNCVDFMKPLSASLLQAEEQSLHRKLWARTIKRQIDAAFSSYAYLRSSSPTFEEIIEADCTGFNEFDFNDYDDRKRATSFLMNRLVESLHLWREELRARQWSSDEIELILSQIRALKKPKLLLG